MEISASRHAAPSCNSPCEGAVSLIGKVIRCPTCHHAFDAVKFSHQIILRHFVRIAVGNFIVTEEQLERIASEQKQLQQLGQTIALEDLLVEKGLITIDQRNRVMASALRKLNRMLISLAVEKNLISLKDGAKTLDRQAADFQKGQLTLVGDILSESALLPSDIVDDLIVETEKEDVDKRTGKTAILEDTSGKYPLAGRIALEKGVISLKDFERATRIKVEKEKQGKVLSFQDVLYESGIISEETRNKLVFKTLKRIDHDLGKIAVENGFVGKKELIAAIEKQTAFFKEYPYVPLCQMLLTDEEMTEKEVERIWDAYREIDSKEAQDLVMKGRAILSSVESSTHTGRGAAMDQPGGGNPSGGIRRL